MGDPTRWHDDEAVGHPQALVLVVGLGGAAGGGGGGGGLAFHCAIDGAAANELVARLVLEDRGVGGSVIAVWAESGDEPEPEVLASACHRFAADPTLGLSVLAPADRSTTELGLPALIARLRSSHPADGPARSGPTVAVRLDGLDRSGAFDPAMPGLGWADVAHRMRRAGWRCDGLPSSSVLSDTVLGHLPPAERFRAEGLWLTRHATDAGPSLQRFRWKTIGAALTVAAIGPHRRRAVAIGRDTLAGWAGPRPHEAQRDTGHRADWRFLLPATDAGPAHTIVLDGPSPDPAAWHWLEADRWTDRLTLLTDAANESQPEGGADLVVVGPDGEVEAGLDLVGADGVVCVLRRRPSLATVVRSIGGCGPVRTLRRRGFATRRYLVLPDLDRAKRYIPLDHPGGVSWLLAAQPPLSGTAGLRVRLLRRLGRLAGPLVRFVGATVVIGTAPDGTGRPVGGVAGSLLPTDTTDLIVIGSGFDEGSRAVLLPLGLPAARPSQAPAPSQVVKASARPRFNRHLDQEWMAIGQILDGRVPGGVVPQPSPPVDVGTLRASTEPYLGRWTVADLLHEQPDPAAQHRLLELSTAAIVDLGQATRADPLTWSADDFDQLVAQPLDQLARIRGRSAQLAVLTDDLARRSSELLGRPLPRSVRHFDLGPWNLVLQSPSLSASTGSALPGVTIIDWESGPPRHPGQLGPAGCDLIYFVKYWLHPALGTSSVDDEQEAFPFLAPTTNQTDPRHRALKRLRVDLAGLGVEPAFVPLLTVHTWAEAACYVAGRRRAEGSDDTPGDPGTAVDYLLTLSRHRHQLLSTWSH